MKSKWYTFQKYAGPASRYTCPACGRRRCLTLYVDAEGQPFSEVVGRCDHLSKCGYDYTPEDYFRDNPDKVRSRGLVEVRAAPVRMEQPGFIPDKYVDGSFRPQYDSHFTSFLGRILDPLVVEGLIFEYRLGVTRDRDVIFFQIDSQGRCRSGKIMKYDPVTGHRVKGADGSGGRVDWVHARLKKDGRLPEGWALSQCLFGEHLLQQYPDATVCLVESEKTAVVCAGVMPKHIWLATGGKACLGDKLSVLKGRRAIAFPDMDAYEDWKVKLARYPFIEVSDRIEKIATDRDRERHADIADLFIDRLLPERP